MTETPGAAPPAAPSTPEGQAPAQSDQSGKIGHRVDPRLDASASSPDDDRDSAFGDDLDITSTASINSSILNYRKIHGRTYQNFEGAEHWEPNDTRHTEVLDIAHHTMYLALNNRLYLAPLDNPQKVLDVGTGTGIWAIDFADEHPEAEVIGTDLSPIQPVWVPPNCRFELDNAEEEWTYPDNSFDFIHIRGLIGCVRDWEKLYRNVLRTLKPGGWFEHHEFSIPVMARGGSVAEDSIWAHGNNLYRAAGERMGRTFLVPDIWEDKLRSAGFTGEIHRETFKLPFGGWAADPKWKEIGLFNRMCLEQGIDGYINYICHVVMGWRSEEIQVFLAKIRNALRDDSEHIYYPVKVIYIQKPLA